MKDLLKSKRNDSDKKIQRMEIDWENVSGDVECHWPWTDIEEKT